MAFSSASVFADPARDPRAEQRLGVTALGLALTGRWLLAVFVLGGGAYTASVGTLGAQHWLVITSARSFLEVVLAAVTTAGAFALTRTPEGAAEKSGAGLRVLALADLALVLSWALEAPLLPWYATARLVAMSALVHASFAYVALRHIGEVCAQGGEHGAAAWAQASAWAFFIAAVLALGSATPASWITLGLTLPVTNPALPVLALLGIFVTLRARRTLL